MRQRKNISRKLFGLILALVGLTVVEVRADDTWTPTNTTNAPSARVDHTAVWTGTEMIVWGGVQQFEVLPSNTGGRYNPATDTWAPTSTINAPSARRFHTAIWTGSEMIVWGGRIGSSFSSNVDTGGRYNPATDTWVPISTINAPGPRGFHTAIWTGSEMIISGGSDGTQLLDTGGRYNPAADIWRPISTIDAPSARGLHTAIWTGSEMIIWGGRGNTQLPDAGGRYNPATDTWRPTSTINVPRARESHTAIWTGTEMIIWGGFGATGLPGVGEVLGTGGHYNPATNSWRPTSANNVASARSFHSAVWTGTEMIVWGGEEGFEEGVINTGGRYNPASDTWRATSTINAPSARESHTAIWTGTEMIIWGGFPVFTTGGRYDAATSNPIDDALFFVRQQYVDFLNREPDASGLSFWTNEITQCAGDTQCIEAKRVNVSAAFFLSIEFQETGYLVLRMYKASYGDRPGTPVPLTRQDFLPDTQRVGQGVVVDAPGWEQQLENNKNAFASEFVARSRFTTAFPQGMTAAQFVDALNANAGGALSQGERDQLVSELASGAKTRAQVLRSVAEDADLARNEFNKAFVLMQYFGYFRRNPNDLPDMNFGGYDFWLNKLTQFNGDFVAAEMVKAFISSGEYRQRFGQP